MTRSRAVLAVLTLAAGLGPLTSCGLADPDRSADARRLVQEVRALPGVASAAERYTRPVTLDSGKVDLTVTMAGDASGAQVVAVGRTAYAAFHSSLSDHETDLHLRAGTSSVHVRGFEPEADVTDVTDELRVAAAVFPRGAVTSDIDTQDVSTGRHLTATVDLRLPAGTTAADLQPGLAALRTTYGDDPQRGWGVRSADGAGLHRDLGFPSPALVARERALASLGAPLARRATVAADVHESPARGFDGYTTTTLTSRSTPLDLGDPAVRDRVITVGERQLDLLRHDRSGFAYALVVDGRTVAEVDSDFCVLDGGPVGRALNRHQHPRGTDGACRA